MEVTFKENTSHINDKVVCDTNVWYDIAAGRFTAPKDCTLVPTMLTLKELATSEKMIHETVLFQKSIKSINRFGKSIIPVAPFDYILHNHDPNYPWDDSLTKKILADFSKLLSAQNINKAKVPEDIKEETIRISRLNREPTNEFAEFANETVNHVRANLTKKLKRKRKTEDTTDINREMMKSLLTEHSKKKGYDIDLENFDWNNIELFMAVTESFFKKLETTEGKKVKPNDAVDWLNMLYVRPGDKYLTFERSWKNYILSDDRIKHYLLMEE